MNSIFAKRNLLTRASLILILLSALAAGSYAQTVLVSDAHTSFTSANGIFGTNPILTVSANNNAYVKFDIARTLPAGIKGDDVARATVKFYVNKVATAGKLDLYPILGDWDEKTITANNAPPIKRGSTGLQSVTTDATLTGDGTTAAGTPTSVSVTPRRRQSCISQTAKSTSSRTDRALS